MEERQHEHHSSVIAKTTQTTFRDYRGSKVEGTSYIATEYTSRKRVRCNLVETQVGDARKGSNGKGTLEDQVGG